MYIIFFRIFCVNRYRIATHYLGHAEYDIYLKDIYRSVPITQYFFKSLIHQINDSRINISNTKLNMTLMIYIYITLRRIAILNLTNLLAIIYMLYKNKHDNEMYNEMYRSFEINHSALGIQNEHGSCS